MAGSNLRRTKKNLFVKISVDLKFHCYSDFYFYFGGGGRKGMREKYLKDFRCPCTMQI